MEPSALNELLDQVTLIDVRGPQEWENGHIEGSINIPLSALQARAAGIPPGRAVITICAVGEVSAAAATTLRNKGLDARNLWGGVAAWTQAGLSLTRPSSRAGERRTEEKR
ncbi:MAG TPA: rhodanese-like domain-containing protein [Actinomycetota bacterium]|nr:rhodanese-like domain-containing protein [Actinomycetota bacterium]